MIKKSKRTFKVSSGANKITENVKERCLSRPLSLEAIRIGTRRSVHSCMRFKKWRRRIKTRRLSKKRKMVKIRIKKNQRAQFVR